MNTKFLILAAATFVVTQCTCQQKSTEMKMPVTSSQEVNSTYPTEKQNIFLEKEKVNITFNKVTEDNRCPMNARCVWAGYASAEIEVMSVHSRPRKFIVSTIDDAGKNLKNSFVFNGHKYTLVNFYPANSTDVNFEKLKGKYVVDIKVE
jgi:uncharacterized protein YdgA (DUF945 family)